MTNRASVAPFPAHLDREAFGHWLTGFADGESSFCLRRARAIARRKTILSARFSITLRADDRETLSLIQSFWHCGRISFFDNRRSKIVNAKPIAVYSVQATPDLAQIVVPHFDRFPLRSKKGRDFAVWKEAVALLDAIRKRSAGGRPGGGCYAKWSRDECQRFLAFKEALQQQRVFENHPSPVSASAVSERTLFDESQVS
jgi:hypothetical protein